MIALTLKIQKQQTSDLNTFFFPNLLTMIAHPFSGSYLKINLIHVVEVFDTRKYLKFIHLLGL